MRRAERGFSLIEMTLALGVFALLLAAVQAGLFSGHKLLASVTRRSDPAADVLVARRVLDRWLGSLTAPAAETDAAMPILKGRRDRLSFFVSLEGAAGGPGLWAVELAIDPGPQGAGGRLSLRRRRVGDPAPAETSVLLDWPLPMFFSYSIGSRQTGLQWSSDTDGHSLPAQVRLMSRQGALIAVRIPLQDNGRCVSAKGAEGFTQGECRVQ